MILKYYPTNGCNFVYELLNGKRSKTSIMGIASKLGIRKQVWSEKELEILYKYYPDEGSQIIKRLPNKTVSQIASKAQTLKIKSNSSLCPRNNKWSPEEDEIIREFYPYEGKLCASHLDKRGEGAVQQRAALLGIKCRS